MRTVTVIDHARDKDDYPHESVQYKTDETGELHVFADVPSGRLQFASYAEGRWDKVMLHDKAPDG
jgi:hypothetical protein